jgi:beta-lactamase class A
LNTNIDKDERDTTTPEAMSALLRNVFTGTVLKPDSIAQLKAWMVATTTGKARIPAGVPAGSVVGHKTGTGEKGAVNDVGVIWAPNQPPVFLSIYTSGGTLDDAGRDQVIADITRLVFDTLNFVDSFDGKDAQSSAS